jgi:hypothetical protein
MVAVYQDPLLLVWLVSFGTGALLFWLPSLRTATAETEECETTGFAPASALQPAGGLLDRLLLVLSIILMSAPLLWPVVYLLIDEDASERGERLANVWPFVLIVSLVLCVLSSQRVAGIRKLLPFILVVTAHGVFLSQQLWGSTYGVWPILVLLVAGILLSLNELTNRQFTGYLMVFTAIASASLITAGAFYVYSNDRLDYVDLADGDMHHSTLPQLAGLSMRGDYLPDFEELVQYTNANIPPDESILELPGEDLFYYTTGRRPTFPVLLFDVTNNPYSPEQIAEMARTRGIKWLIVKNDLQVDTDKTSGDKTIDDKDAIFEAMKPDFKHIESLNNYEIYRRKLPGEADDEDEDDNDSGDDTDDDSGN